MSGFKDGLYRLGMNFPVFSAPYPPLRHFRRPGNPEEKKREFSNRDIYRRFGLNFSVFFRSCFLFRHFSRHGNPIQLKRELSNKKATENHTSSNPPINNVLQIYYCLLFYLLFSRAAFFINDIPWSSVKNIPKINYIGRLLSFNPPIYILSLFFLLSLFFCFLSIFRPQNHLKIATSVSACAVFLVLFTYQTIGHHNHIWMISSVLMCFFSDNRPLISKTNYFIIRLIQALLLSHYFISGLWKLRTLLSAKFSIPLRDMLLEAIAYAQSARGLEFHVFVEFLFKHPELLSVGFFCALLFQLTALLPVIFNNLTVSYGVLAVLFHLLVGVTAGIYFAHTVLAILFFLIIVETMMRKHKPNSLDS